MESRGRQQQQQPDRQAGGPLAGVRVIDASVSWAAPYAGMLLADLGADVVELETPPHGDPSRRRHDHDGYGSTFSGVNRTKRTLLINLKDRRSRPARAWEALLLRVLAGSYLAVVLLVLPPVKGGGVHRRTAGTVRCLPWMLLRSQSQWHADPQRRTGPTSFVGRC